MRRWFARSMKPNMHMSGLEDKKTQALVGKIYHKDEIDHYYKILENTAWKFDAIERMVNGTECIFVKCEKFNREHTEDMIQHFQKFRPFMAVDINNHLFDVQAFSHDRYE